MPCATTPPYLRGWWSGAEKQRHSEVAQTEVIAMIDTCISAAGQSYE